MSILLQIHFQYLDDLDGPTDFVAQQEINSSEELNNWISEVKKEHPLPEGTQYIIHTEKSKYFLKTLK